MDQNIRPLRGPRTVAAAPPRQARAGAAAPSSRRPRRSTSPERVAAPRRAAARPCDPLTAVASPAAAKTSSRRPPAPGLAAAPEGLRALLGGLAALAGAVIGLALAVRRPAAAALWAGRGCELGWRLGGLAADRAWGHIVARPGPPDDVSSAASSRRSSPAVGQAARPTAGRSAGGRASPVRRGAPEVGTTAAATAARPPARAAEAAATTAPPPRSPMGTLARIATPNAWLSSSDMSLVAMILGVRLAVYRTDRDGKTALYEEGGAVDGRRTVAVLNNHDNTHWERLDPATGEVFSVTGDGNCGVHAILDGMYGRLPDAGAERARMLACRARVAAQLRGASDLDLAALGGAAGVGTLAEYIALADL